MIFDRCHFTLEMPIDAGGKFLTSILMHSSGLLREALDASESLALPSTIVAYAFAIIPMRLASPAVTRFLQP